MADCKRKTAQLFDGTLTTMYPDGSNKVMENADMKSIVVPIKANETITYSNIYSTSFQRMVITDDYPENGLPFPYADRYDFTGNTASYTNTENYDRWLLICPYRASVTTYTVDEFFENVMLNSGSTALPYEPYGWVHSLRKLTTATEAIENPLYSDGTAITAYTLKGNTVQDGTPTPSNPVVVNGVGNKTANLWNEDYSGISDTLIYKPLYVGSGDFTLSSTMPAVVPQSLRDLFFLAGNVSSGASSSVNGVYEGRPITVTAIDGYVTIAYRHYSASYPDVRDYKTMLNTGSTALPYEPYGYKIPILNNSQTTNIYLSEQLMKIGDTVDSLISTGMATYNIAKYEFTGNEAWEDANVPIDNTYLYRYPMAGIVNVGNVAALDVVCTHFECGSYYSVGDIGVQHSQARLYYRTTETTLASWKQWLADQYAAGTPVTVWYILATPTTESVTDPSIPTTDGANSITVDTTVQPSEFTATWTGWHDSSVKEYDGTNWQ